MNIVLKDKNKPKTEEESIKERFELLYREVFFAKEQFIILDDIYYNGVIEEYENYDICIFDALEYSILMKLAKIYDNDDRDDSVTLYYMLNTLQSNAKLNKKDSTIIKFAQDKLKELLNINSLDKLKRIRDKNVAHLDKQFPKGIKSIKYPYELSYKELKELLNFALDVIKKVFYLVYKEQILDDSMFKKLEFENRLIRNMKMEK